jgi:hypothetical protein
MAIWESIILVCTLVGKLSIGTILKAKGCVLEFLVDFRQKDEKSTRRRKVNSWSTPTLERQRVNIKSRKWGTREFRKIDQETEKSSKVNHGQLRRSKSRSKSKSTLWLITRSFQGIKDYARYGVVTLRLFIPFVPYRILPHYPSFNPSSHWM